MCMCVCVICVCVCVCWNAMHASALECVCVCECVSACVSVCMSPSQQSRKMYNICLFGPKAHKVLPMPNAGSHAPSHVEKCSERFTLEFHSDSHGTIPRAAN